MPYCPSLSRRAFRMVRGPMSVSTEMLSQRSRPGRIGSVAHEPFIEPWWCHVISKVATAYLERLGSPYQDVDGSCRPRPMVGAYREIPPTPRLTTSREPGVSTAKLSPPLAPHTFLVVIGVADT
jgi:hypothetical protein